MRRKRDKDDAPNCVRIKSDGIGCGNPQLRGDPDHLCSFHRKLADNRAEELGWMREGELEKLRQWNRGAFSFHATNLLPERLRDLRARIDRELDGDDASDERRARLLGERDAIDAELARQAARQPVGVGR